jgi:hypothetical protein
MTSIAGYTPAKSRLSATFATVDSPEKEASQPTFGATTRRRQRRRPDSCATRAPTEPTDGITCGHTQGVKPYACTVCDFRSGRPSHLNLHMKTHTGERDSIRLQPMRRQLYRLVCVEFAQAHSRRQCQTVAVQALRLHRVEPERDLPPRPEEPQERSRSHREGVESVRGVRNSRTHVHMLSMRT